MLFCARFCATLILAESISHLISHSERGRLALAALIIGAIAIGLSPIFVRLSDIGPTASAFWRVALAAPALWAWAWFAAPAKSAGASPRRRYNPALIAVGLSFAGDLSFWHWSIKFTSVANATLLANLAAVFVTLVAWLWFRERISRTFIFGMAVALAGTVTLTGRSMSTHSSHLLGDAFGVITALFYTAFLILTKRLRDAGYSTAFIVSRATLVTAIALLPLALLSDGALYPTTLRGWSVLLALALISHAGGQTLIAYALAHLPAAFSSVTLMLEPVVAALLAWVLFGERLGPLELAGAALVLTGIYLARRGSYEKEKAPCGAHS